jgi:hypothetical protein
VLFALAESCRASPGYFDSARPAILVVQMFLFGAVHDVAKGGSKPKPHLSNPKFADTPLLKDANLIFNRPPGGRQVNGPALRRLGSPS